MISTPHFRSFKFCTYFFVFSIYFFIFRCRPISSLWGWDLLGLTSYLLVTFYPGHSSRGSGMLTYGLNRIGDVFLMVSFSVVIGALCLRNVQPLPSFYAYIFVFGCFTKRALIPWGS